jgi:hypothetical protein
VRIDAAASGSNRLLAALRLAAAVFVGVAVSSLIAPTARAQASPKVTLAASTVDRCMTPGVGERAKPVYPAWELERKQGANVNVEFVFEAPDRAPKVHYLAPEPQGGFRDSVDEYAAKLRLPCLPPRVGATTLRQGFDFVPNDGRKVVWTALTDVADAERDETLKCLSHPSGDDARIRYPHDMELKLKQGLVMARVHFVDGAKSPVSEMLYDGDGKSFGRAVEGYLAAMRLPCMRDLPVDALIRFNFTLEGEKPDLYVLNDLGLVQFLGAAKAVSPGSVFFDTASMKCPFDVRFTLHQPFERNRVELLDEDVPSRRALADWLATREFDLPPRSAAHLYGQSMTIHIPCARIDL